ncbi:MAG: DTW domain-containing protein [Comamonas sp.]|nr:DTW domain-containing protein [Comamonas sp.]
MDTVPAHGGMHAVARLRRARLALSTRPFLARGGPKGQRCEGCRLRPSHCMCAAPVLQADVHAGVCLLMHDAEPLKPSNTGWLIADVVPDTFAFGWSRMEASGELLALLDDPKWQPFVVFPGEYADSAERVVHSLAQPGGAPTHRGGDGRRPLFVLLDATWSQARKMFRKSPYLDRFPVLSLHPDQVSAYRLRRSNRDDHFCTSEVASLCLELSQDFTASQVLAAWLDVFTHHYERARNQLPPDFDGPEHRRLGACLGGAAQAAG